jgi:SAM-dependent methyltransferase
MKKPNEWQVFFNEYAPQYNNEVFTQNTTDEITFLEEELELPFGSTILDVGCGTGRHSVALAKKGYKMTGVDISQSMLEVARGSAETAGVVVELMCSNIMEFTPSKKFQAAICLCEGALCLLGSGDDPYERDEKVLKKIADSLEHSGRFILTALNGCRQIRLVSDEDVRAGKFDPVTMTENYQMKAKTPTGEIFVDVRERLYTPAEFIGMLKRVGFVIDHIWGGTAGDWHRHPMQLDEMEFMVIAHKS